jgi:hypothetical protein
MSKVVNDFLKIIATGYVGHRRMRLAVTPEEYEEVRQYMFDHYGEFYSRIMNIPLVVEADPENPSLTIQVK